LTRYLTAQGVRLVEVTRPNRQERRRRGKSDTVDAIAAARATANGEACNVPKDRDGAVEAIRVLRVAQRSARNSREQVAHQIRALIVTAPAALRERLEVHVTIAALVKACVALRPRPGVADPTEATKRTLRLLARRHRALTGELAEIDAELHTLCAQVNPALLGAYGVGADVASALLVTAGGNPERLRSEASFAALCGVSPVAASSGKIVRFRLNRGGDREANAALWRIVMNRIKHDPRTKAYVARRLAEGKTIAEIIRCLKRYVAREIYRLLVDPPAVPAGPDLRTRRHAAGITLVQAAEQLGTWPTRISELERQLDHNTDLAIRYDHWLRSSQQAA
jgi:hypothetical protein